MTGPSHLESRSLHIFEGTNAVAGAEWWNVYEFIKMDTRRAKSSINYKTGEVDYQSA